MGTCGSFEAFLGFAPAGVLHTSSFTETLNEDTGYVRHPEDVRLLPGSGEAVRLLNQAGFRVVLVTSAKVPRAVV